MTWRSAADAMDDIQERRAARDEARQRERVEHIRKEALELRRRWGWDQDETPAVQPWTPPVPITWNGTVGEHRDGYYVWANPRHKQRLLWYAVCSCGWHSRRGFRLRESALESWRNHLGGEAAS